MMKLTLTEYVKTHGYNINAACDLIKEFKEGFPPSYKHFPKNDYVSEHYEKKNNIAPLTGIFCALIEKILSPINLRYNKNNFIYIEKLFGFRPDSKEKAMKCFLFSRASTYKLIHAGNCSYRASYAAIILASIFEKKDIEVRLISVPERDQFIVKISDKKDSHYIYDPLTNPELVFEYKQYQEKIMSTFSLVPWVAQPVNLLVTKEMSENFTEKWSTIKPELIKLLQESKFSTDIVLEDPAFINALLNNGILKNEWRNKTEEALQLIKKIHSASDLNKEYSFANKVRVNYKSTHIKKLEEFTKLSFLHYRDEDYKCDAVVELKSEENLKQAADVHLKLDFGFFATIDNLTYFIITSINCENNLVHNGSLTEHTKQL